MIHVLEEKRVISIDRSESALSEQQRRSLEHACLCAKIADDYRGQETVVLDLTSITPIVDFFVLTTGNSKRQMHAIAEEIERVMKQEGSPPLSVEGYSESSWILQDFGDIVLHVFTPETRAIYDLERLWADAERVDWRAVLSGETVPRENRSASQDEDPPNE